ncbi:ABC transporter ATP-binding protein [Streptomyces sp. NBC_01497]|uniref:ABC transporter ATP-binding protein n=1 Tax=Streptomyces sp. NBC_01497 TaxID=2903885 RepID=UPI002E3048D0|nr:ABC transporter ATP-binding protein [Streptomyces sp. NBC_01497]
MSTAPASRVLSPPRERADGTLLSIAGLSVSYGTPAGGGTRPRGPATRVLSGVGLTVRAGEIVGIIGETGSGKTTLARAAVGLVRPEPGARVLFEGRDLARTHGAELRDFRRSGRMQYMFQDPLRSQDPELTVRAVVAEPLAAARTGDRRERAARADEALGLVGLDPVLQGPRTPGELSGGQRQRVSLARALVTRPRLLITDEPASALDASNRNLVLGLLDRLRAELGLAVVVISHDLGSLAGIADRVAVLYRGRLVEDGPANGVLSAPRHPYTALLTASAPRVAGTRGPRPALLRPDPDRVPWPEDRGCVFAPRCRFAGPECVEEPTAEPVPGGNGSEEVLPGGPSTGGEVNASAGGTSSRAARGPASGAPGRAVPHTVACHHAANWRTRLGT